MADFGGGDMGARVPITVAILAIGAFGSAAAQDAPREGAPPASENVAPVEEPMVSELPAVVVTGQKKRPPRRATNKSAPIASEPGVATGNPELAPPVATDLNQGISAAAADARYLPTPGTLISPQTGGNASTLTTSRDLLATHGATITDTLQNQPGVAGSTFAPGANRPIVRGLDNNRVRIQENGIATGDVSDISEDHAVPVDPYSADSITVIRGPETVRYGSQAIGGVVSTNNQRIPTSIPLNAVGGEIMGGWSSVDSGRDGAFKATATSHGFVVHADGFARHADDYDTPEGKQENSFVTSEGASIGGSYIWRDGFFGVNYTRFDSLYAVPGTESAEEKSRIDMGQDKISAKGEWRAPELGIAAARSWFGWTNYAHNELAFEADENADEVASRFTNKYTEGRAEIESVPTMTAFGALTSTAGIQISNRKLVGTSFEGDSMLDPNTTDSIGAYLFEDLRITKPLRLQAGVRIEHDDVRGTTYEDIRDPAPDSLVAQRKSFDPKSGSLGLLYDLPRGVVARLTGQYAERAPAAQELFSKGAHEATETFEIGNPDIGIETAKSIELGFNKAAGRWRFDTSAYFTKYDGYIFRDLTGAMCGETIASCGSGDPDNALKEVIFNQRDATFYGVEVATEYDIGRVFKGIWGVSGQYDFVHAEFSDGEYVPRIPPHRLGGGFYYRDDAWQAKLTSLYAFRQDDTSPHETPTADYTLLNAEVSYTMELDPVGAITPKLVVGVKGENLLNEDIRNSASFKKDEVLAPGANARIFGKFMF